MTLPVVVLVRPQQEGNIGAVARAMANMGLTALRQVEPAPELGSGRTRSSRRGLCRNISRRTPLTLVSP